MSEIHNTANEPALVPIIVDVERNIDGYRMIRCSYFAVQSDEPLPNWRLRVGEFDSPILLLNLEAILLGAPSNPDGFGNVEEINAMYDYIEKHDELFVDINDIWVPIEWFGNIEIKQGLLFRIPADQFSICWKLRNDKISVEEMFLDEDVQDEDVKSKLIQQPHIEFSESETSVFEQWTNMQIEQSRAQYNERKEMALKKIRT